MNNQRKNPRLECSVPVDSKENTVFDRLHTVDFSKGGLGFITDHEIPLENEIIVELDLKENGNPVFVKGKVKWIRKIAETGMFRVGLSFVDVIKGSKSRLENYFE